MEAKTSLQDRDAKLGEVSELIEKDLKLLGCTAIEDKLQEGVPQCIKQLALAGINLWVLTGDKMETAINIGFACSLLTEEMDQFIVSAYTPEMDKLEAEGKIEEAARLGHERISDCLHGIAKEMSLELDNKTGKWRRPATARKADKRLFAMVIDGKALSFALTKGLNQLFLVVGRQCKAVVCCRVSPLQKAQVTELVRNDGDITLAIGDGANDVGMIQKAHIGVGISGQEGMQAVMSADFAIAQFRFLTPLLLVHGRWSYKRIARMINFFFFKNLLFGTTIFTFNAFTSFSGQYMYNDFYMTLFNVVFTSLTPFAIGAFDRDLDREFGLRYPSLYKQGQRNQYLNFFAIVGWLCSSLFQCAVIMVLIMLGCNSLVIGHPSGQTFGMFETGILMFSIVVVVVHLQVICITEQWTVIHHIAVWLSQAVWWLFLLAFGAFPISLSGDLYYLFIGVVAPNAQYWLYLLVVPLACQLPDFTFRQLRRHLYPEDHHILQELYLKEKAERRATKNLSDPSIVEGSTVLARVFGDGATPHRKKNTGWVPPYHKDSRFYNFVTSFNGNKSSSAAPTPQQQTTPGSSFHNTARNPVLAHLDQEMAMHPHRTSAAGMNKIVAMNNNSTKGQGPATSSSPPNGNGVSVNGAAPGGGSSGHVLMQAYMTALR